VRDLNHDAINDFLSLSPLVCCSPVMLKLWGSFYTSRNAPNVRTLNGHIKIPLGDVASAGMLGQWNFNMAVQRSDVRGVRVGVEWSWLRHHTAFETSLWSFDMNSEEIWACRPDFDRQGQKRIIIFSTIFYVCVSSQTFPARDVHHVLQNRSVWPWLHFATSCSSILHVEAGRWAGQVGYLSMRLINWNRL